MTSILEQIAVLRTTESDTSSPINSLLNSILDHPECTTHMENIIEAILHTRDIHSGRGLRELTNCYLYTLQQKFPMKAIFTLYMIVDSHVGSWRDVRAYCEFVANHSKKGRNDPIIKPIIGLYNNQLIKDVATWKEVLQKCEQEGLPKPDARKHISFAAKWVPRETKGRRWLFDMLVLMWVYKDVEYKNIINSAKTPDALAAAERKCKMMYRKMVSNLNKELDTLEIKQCANQWADIDPDKLSTNQLFTGKDRFLKAQCASTFDATYKEKLALITQKKFSYNVPMWKLVKHMVRLSKDPTKKEELELMNLHWPVYLQHNFNDHRDYYISIVDVTESMYLNGAKNLYNAIGAGCVVASKSHFGQRVIVLANKPELIDLADCSFSEMVNMMMMPLNRDNYAPPIYEGFRLVLNAVITSGMTASEASSLKIKLYTNQQDIDYSLIAQMWQEAGFVAPHIS
jgi:hypothetical protein